MSLKYSLLENQLTSDPDDYKALIQDAEVLVEEDLIDDMTSRGSTATKTDALAVLEEYKAAVVRAVASGKRINTDLVNISSSVRGVFNGDADRFDPGRHSVRINVRPGVRLQGARDDVSLEKVPTGEIGPVLDHYHDTLADETDGLVTPGGGARIWGANLKIRSDLPGSGIFFVDSEGNDIEVTHLIRNKPAEVIFLVPDLAPGDYALEVRTAAHSSKYRRTSRLEGDLTVAG